MVTSPPIKIGFIGCGNIANAHMSAIERIPEIEIVAGADINVDRAREFVEKAGAEAYFTDWRQMLEEVELDAIDQCTPHTLHMEPTLAAAKRGIHVLTEKPMATELGECDRMIAACQQAGVVLMVGQVLRFYAPHIEARKIVSSGHLGQIKNVIRRRWGYSKDVPSQPWSADPALSGGWALYGLGSHAADLILWMTDSEATKVFAMGRQINPSWDDVDEVTIQMELSNGAMALQTHCMNCYANAWDLAVNGTDDSLYVNGETLIVGGEERHVPMQEGGGMYTQIAEFASAVLEGREPEASGEDVRRTYALLEAAKLSMKEGRIVDASQL